MLGIHGLVSAGCLEVSGSTEVRGHEESCLVPLVRQRFSSCWARSLWTVTKVRFSSVRRRNSSSRRAISMAMFSSSTSSASSCRLSGWNRKWVYLKWRETHSASHITVKSCVEESVWWRGVQLVRLAVKSVGLHCSVFKGHTKDVLHLLWIFCGFVTFGLDKFTDRNVTETYSCLTNLSPLSVFDFVGASMCMTQYQNK